MSTARHMYILAALLAAAGVILTLYQILALGTPLKEGELTDVWTVDARFTFNLPEPRAVELEVQLPPLELGFDVTNELFIAKGYGQTVLDSGASRAVHWTSRRASGPQTLFYRFNVTRAAAHSAPPPGETWREPITVPDAELNAMQALLSDIRAKSVDTVSFIATAINKLAETSDNNIRLLLAGDNSAENKLRVLELLLSQAHIPMQRTRLLRLSDGGPHETEVWGRSYIEVSKEHKAGWYYFDLKTIYEGLPPDRLLWWSGDEPMVKSPAGVNPRVSLQTARDEMAAISLQRLSNGQDFSLYSLPLETQQTYRLMLMIPFGVFIILILRNLVGMDTLGTFTPVLIALAFRETGLIFGLVFFSVIISAGLLLRAYLEQLRLQMLPRLSLVLTCVILLIVATSMISFKLGLHRGLAVTLFPMVILTMSIERISVTWDERGGAQAFRVTLGTLAAASCVYLTLALRPLSYLVFTFPGILLPLMAVMLLLGRYSGYRLSELTRFKALLDKGK